VIGGGAAGFFAAIHAARNGAEVLLIEKSNKVLGKVKVSGGGRCNVTNIVSEPTVLVKNYPRGSKELLSPFTRFNSTDTCNWFEKRGVSIKAEADGRMFPVTDTSQTIINCLMDEAVNSGVKIKYQTDVQKIKFRNGAFELLLPEDKQLKADRLIIATGGSPYLKNYQWLEELGHTIIPPVPSLFTFNIPQNAFQDLMGLSVEQTEIKIANSLFKQTGPLLFTHWGLSGPAVLKLSAWAARLLFDQQYNFTVRINFFPEMNEQQLVESIQVESKKFPGKRVVGQGFKKIPSRLWERLCLQAGISEIHKWNETGKKSMNRLTQLLTGLEMKVSGKTTFKEEFVTCGGVNLKEVNMKTMESKIVPGIYFAGEVLDIDGVTGGFNFQAAWTTGFIAGNAAYE